VAVWKRREILPDVILFTHRKKQAIRISKWLQKFKPPGVRYGLCLWTIIPALKFSNANVSPFANLYAPSGRYTWRSDSPHRFSVSDWALVRSFSWHQVSFSYIPTIQLQRHPLHTVEWYMIRWPSFSFYKSALNVNFKSKHSRRFSFLNRGVGRRRGAGETKWVDPSGCNLSWWARWNRDMSVVTLVIWYRWQKAEKYLLSDEYPCAKSIVLLCITIPHPHSFSILSSILLHRLLRTVDVIMSTFLVLSFPSYIIDMY